MFHTCHVLQHSNLISFQESLGDVVYAQLPEPDDVVAAGEDCGALESVKGSNSPELLDLGDFMLISYCKI